MQELGHPGPPQVFEFILADPGPVYQVPSWYLQLIERCRVFSSQGGELALVESPTGAYRWFNATLIEREMQNPTDTHGLDQAPPPSLATPAPPQQLESLY